MEAIVLFSSVIRQLELWLKLSKFAETKYRSTVGRILAVASSSLSFPFPFSPSSWFPAACSHAEPQHLLSLHPAFWSIAVPTPSESARLSPGLSRLGQYRKRLTCTLTRIHVEPRVRASLYQHIALLWRGPATDLWHRPSDLETEFVT